MFIEILQNEKEKKILCFISTKIWNIFSKSNLSFCIRNIFIYAEIYSIFSFAQIFVKEEKMIKRERELEIYNIYVQGVHCDMLESKCIFCAEKLISQA